MSSVDALIEQKDFDYIQGLVYKQTGIVIADHKRDMISRRLHKRVRALKMPSIADYCDFLKHKNPADEMVNFINSVTTNLTSFYREKHHFDYLHDEYLPSFKKTGKKRLRLWSSACSTGEEPYSIAMTMLDVLGDNAGGIDAKILATDLDTEVIEKAKSGRYEEKSLSNIPDAKVKKWLKNNGVPDQGYIEVADKLKPFIQFNKLNLLGEWPMKGMFDVIFCRNVFIYFDKSTQSKLVSRFYNALEPNGVLMLGHSESILKGDYEFQGLGKTIFLKK